MTNRAPSKVHSTVHLSQSSPDVSNNDPLSLNPTKELDAIYRDLEVLRRNGTSADTVIAHLEKRLQGISARQNKETDEVISEIYVTQASAPKGFVLPQRNPLPFIALAIVFAGCFLEATIGNQFVFSAANQYRATLPWLITFLAPILAWMWFVLERKNPAWVTHYPTWWNRWLLVFPGMVAGSSAIVAIFPLGWLALYGELSGARIEGLEAKMLSVAAYSPNSRGCHKTAEIIIKDNSARICLDKAISGRAPVAGETVNVDGEISMAGVFIDEVRTR